jgi:starvation-inducible outer membrane lipoprotein
MRARQSGYNSAAKDLGGKIIAIFPKEEDRKLEAVLAPACS